MVVAETLPSGLRLVTEAMPHVRSVTVGVWLTRGSRHETDAESGVAHFVEHMLFKGTTTRSAQRHRADDRLDRRPARRVHGEGIRRLLHQGARRASAARDRSAERHGACARRSRPPTSTASRASSSKRSRWSRTRPTISCTRSSRSSSGRSIRWAGRFSGTPETVGVVRVRRPARLLRPHLRRAEPGRRRRRATSSTRQLRDLVERAFAAPAGARRRLRRTEPPAVTPGVVERAEGHRAEPPLPRHAAPIRRRTPIGTRCTC